MLSSITNPLSIEYCPFLRRAIIEEKSESRNLSASPFSRRAGPKRLEGSHHQTGVGVGGIPSKPKGFMSRQAIEHSTIV